RDVVVGDMGRVQYRDSLGQMVAVFGFGGRGDKISSQVVNQGPADVVDAAWIISRNLTLGGSDIVQGDGPIAGDEDILIGGAGGGLVHRGFADEPIFCDPLEAQRRADVITNPPVPAPHRPPIYDTSASTSAGGDLTNGVPRNYRDQDGTIPSWAEWLIVNMFHTAALEATPDGSFGNDYIAGGPKNDVIFGQLGNDTIQGDGSI